MKRLLIAIAALTLAACATPPPTYTADAPELAKLNNAPVYGPAGFMVLQPGEKAMF